MKKIITYILLLASWTVFSADKIDWLEWSQQAFDKAKQLNRPMIINVGHEGCIACRWMKRDTFTNPGVVKLVNENFIAIQVDSEMRPDIGEQYSDWAWPATAFNHPDGTQIFAMRGNRSPESFSITLNKIIKNHKAGTLKTDDTAPYAAPEGLRNASMKAIRDQVRSQLDVNFDDELGGWKSDTKILEYAEPYLNFAYRAKVESDKKSKERFLKTAYGFVKHIDKEVGGVFYESYGNFDEMILEKRLETQAAGLQLFATAYKLTGDKVFTQALSRIQSYLNTTLRSKSGLYFASQQSVLPEGATTMTIKAYYDLDKNARDEIGQPLIDRSLYTDHNARVITGLIMAYEATENIEYLTSAKSVATALINHRKSDAGHFVQFRPDSEFRPSERIHTVLQDSSIYLRPHAYLGLAFIDLHRATADNKWLNEAQNIVGVLSKLKDNNIGGFFGSRNQIIPRKPLEDNAAAARFMYFMGVLEKNDDYKKDAQNAIKASASKEIVEREGRITGNVAQTTDLLTSGYVEFTVVTTTNSADAQVLYDSAQQVFEPRKILHYEKPGRYPKNDKPALFICSEIACSPPIYKTTDIVSEANKFLNIL